MLETCLPIAVHLHSTHLHVWCFTAKLCVRLQAGKAALTVREDTRGQGERDTQKVQEPASKAWRDMAIDAADHQVSLSSSPPHR